MLRRATLSIAPVMLFLSIVLTFAPAVAATPCESLAAALPPGTTGITTQSVAGGSFTPPGSSTITNLPAFCRVAATLTSTSTSLIGVEVWMPTTTWNGNFRGEGSGGGRNSRSDTLYFTAGPNGETNGVFGSSGAWSTRARG